MQAIGTFAQTASSCVYPYLPIMQATSTTTNIVSTLWQKLPGWARILVILSVVIGLVFLALQIYWGVSSLKRRFYIDPKLSKLEVYSDFFKDVCRSLVAMAKERAARSTELYNQKQKEESFAHACASAALLNASLVVMPNMTRELMPSCDDAIAKVNAMLKQKHKPALPAPIILKQTDPKKK